MISASISLSPNATMALSSKSSSSYKNKTSSSSSRNNNNYTSPMTLHHRTTSFFKRQHNEKVSTVVRAENKGEEPRLTRKKEAETEAFLSPAEKSGENPLKDPMAIIGIVGILGVPALILLVGVTSGYIGQ